MLSRLCLLAGLRCGRLCPHRRTTCQHRRHRDAKENLCMRFSMTALEICSQIRQQAAANVVPVRWSRPGRASRDRSKLRRSAIWSSAVEEMIEAEFQCGDAERRKAPSLGPPSVGSVPIRSTLGIATVPEWAMPERSADDLFQRRTCPLEVSFVPSGSRFSQRATRLPLGIRARVRGAGTSALLTDHGRGEWRSRRDRRQGQDPSRRGPLCRLLSRRQASGS